MTNDKRHFSYLCTLIVKHLNVKVMLKKPENQLIRGGGAAILTPRVKPKIARFIQTYHHCTPHELKPMKRYPFLFIMSDYFMLPYKEVMEFFGMQKSNLYSELKKMRYMHDISSRQRDEELRIYRYILYSAQWNGGESM